MEENHRLYIYSRDTRRNNASLKIHSAKWVNFFEDFLTKLKKVGTLVKNGSLFRRQIGTLYYGIV